MYIVFLFSLLATLGTKSVFAADFCELYVEFCPNYQRQVQSGGSYPSFSDTFNVNPASIPTTETPLGVEGIVTTGGDRSKATTNFTLIKGFDRAGFGIANNSDKTLYTYNILQGLEGTPYQSAVNGYQAANSAMSSLNFGSAIAPLPSKLIPFLSSPTVGANLRYNQLTQKWDLQYGTSINAEYFTVGVSYRNSIGSGSAGNYIATMSTTALTAGTKLGPLDLEYTLLFLKTPDPTLQVYSFFTKPVKIFTAALNLDSLHFTFAHREAYNVQDFKITTNLFAAQIELTKKLAVAFQHNYIPGSESLSAQLLF